MCSSKANLSFPCHFHSSDLRCGIFQLWSPAGSLPFDKLQCCREEFKKQQLMNFSPPFHSLPPTFPSSLWYTNSRDVLASGPLHCLFPLSEMLSTNCSFSCVILLSLKCHLIIEAFPDSPV